MSYLNKNMCRLILIHAMPVSIEPINTAFQREWPEAETVNILDDSLGKDLNSGTHGREHIEERIVALGKYGVHIGGSAILYSCSAFGEEIEAAKKEIEQPVLKPNEAMFEEAIESGGRIGMIATFKPSIPSMEHEFYEMAGRLNKQVKLDSIFVDGALAALSEGKADAHNEMIRKASAVFEGYQSVMLAQFSAAQASVAVEEQLGCAVLTSPESAVLKLKKRLMG